MLLGGTSSKESVQVAGVALLVIAGDGAGVSVPKGVFVAVSAGVLLVDAVSVGVGVSVPVLLGTGVAVWVGVSDAVADGVAVGHRL